MAVREIVFLALLVLQFSLTCTASTTNLQLLVFLPNSTDAREVTTNCLDLGEELIPAAEIAAERINNNPEILPGFTLQISPTARGTNICSDSSIATSLGSFADFVSRTTQPDSNIVGLIGLVCPATLLGLSPVASLPNIDILHISSSTTSPRILQISRQKEIGRLYQIAPSSTVYNEAVLAMMQERSEPWKSISVIRHTESISVENDHIASDFEERIRQIEGEGFGLTLYAETASGEDVFVRNVERSAIRIIYTSVRDSEARKLLCTAYESKIKWPNYLWIFHDLSLGDLLYNTDNCSLQDMHLAVEGIVLLHHDVNSEYDRIIDLANYTYGEYLALYNQSLENITSPTCNQEPGILSANALHDSVIAFAYALNKSLSDMPSDCIGPGMEDCLPTTKTIESHLKTVEFSGAGGEISFDPVTHELTATSAVNIFQILDGVPSLLARFNGSSIKYEGNNTLNIDHTFDNNIIRLPLALPLITLVVVGICIVITIVVSILFIHYHNSPEIKATSPLLSSIILFSCFLLFSSVIITTTRYGFARGQVYANLCASEIFLYLVGVQLIFATLFIRLLRVSRIFFNYEPVGVAWSDKVLTLYITAILSVTVVFLIVWMAVGDFRTVERSTFVSFTSPPRFNIEQSCVSNHQPLFLSLLFGYSGILMLLVLILAIKTRKVTIDIFKDTKSVNIFIFCSVTILGLFIPLSFITQTLPGITALILSFLFHVVPLSVVATVCVCLLFIPKLYRSRFPSSNPNSKSIGNRSSNCFGPPGSDGFSLSKNSAYEQVKLKFEQA